MIIYFIRHGEPDYSFIKEDDNCQWANLAPLSGCGIEQAIELKMFEDLKDGIIISSPYTRALQTASILANGKNILIEPKLHEWLPSKNFSIKIKEIPYVNKEFKNDTQNCNYETKEEMINRMNYIINKYRKYEKIIIVAHSRLISTYLQSIGIDKRYLNYCEIFKLEN